MYNNLIFLTNPVNGAQLLMQLTLWTFSVNSIRGGYNAGICKFGRNAEGVRLPNRNPTSHYLVKSVMFLDWCLESGTRLGCQANLPARTCSLCSQRTLCLCLYWPPPSSLQRSCWSSSAVLRRAKRQADYLVGTALNWYYFPKFRSTLV